MPLALIVDGLPSGDAQWRAAGFAAASGIFEFLGLGALLKGLSTGNLSVVTPLGSLAGGFAAIGAILLGESLAPIAWVGLPLAVIGGLMASVERAPAEGDGEGRRTRATAGAGWALLSAVLFAGTLLFFAEATALPPISLAAVGRASTTIVVIPVALLSGGRRAAAGLPASRDGSRRRRRRRLRGARGRDQPRSGGDRLGRRRAGGHVGGDHRPRADARKAQPRAARRRRPHLRRDHDAGGGRGWLDGRLPVARPAAGVAGSLRRRARRRYVSVSRRSRSRPKGRP